MKRVVLFLILVLPISVYAVDKEYFLAKGAKCTTEETTICVLKDDKYPQSIAYIFNDNQTIDHLLFHLHGHSFGPLSTGEDFDSTPIDLVRTFKFNSAVSKHPNLLMVIPFTTGKCTDFDNYLRHDDHFEVLIESIKSQFNPVAKVHLSAHSGGGRTIARTINKMSTIISSVSLFDAIYNPPLSVQYTSWFKLPNKNLNLITVAPKEIGLDYTLHNGKTPFNESKNIFMKIASSMQTIEDNNLIIHKKNAESSSASFIYQPLTGSYHHWYIVRDSFNLVLSTIIQ